MWDSMASLFSSGQAAAGRANATAQTANTIDMTQKLANMGSLVGELSHAYGSVMGANLQNGYAKKMLNAKDNIAYQKERKSNRYDEQLRPPFADRRTKTLFSGGSD